MAENKTHYSFGTYSLVDLREYLLSWSHIFFLNVYLKQKEREGARELHMLVHSPNAGMAFGNISWDMARPGVPHG